MCPLSYGTIFDNFYTYLTSSQMLIWKFQIFAHTDR